MEKRHALSTCCMVRIDFIEGEPYVTVALCWQEKTHQRLFLSYWDVTRHMASLSSECAVGDRWFFGQINPLATLRCLFIVHRSIRNG